MNQRIDYEHLERDFDGSYYWWINKDVYYCSTNCEFKLLADLSKWFHDRESKLNTLYYKGTRLYFTYYGKKFHLSWVFYSKKLISDTVKKLRKLGAYNIQINYGELD